jgi:EAL domain-containing protein (putative c-di-GMP-specific phosphodiesterase class I)/PAS domain-containing protein
MTTSHAASSAAPPVMLRSERDRFVALAFCWAELLVELDRDGCVVFAAGAAETLLGRAASTLVGLAVADLVAPVDRSLVSGILGTVGGEGRVSGVPLRLLAEGGGIARVTMAGYRLPDVNGHYFLGFHHEPAEPAGDRDAATGLLTAEAFADLVASTAIDGGSGDGHGATLIRADGCNDLRARMSDRAHRELLGQIGTFLCSNAVHGSAAARFSDDCYGLLHPVGLDVAALRRGFADLIRHADPSAEGVDVDTATLSIDGEGMTEADLVKGLVYGINRFRAPQGRDLSLASLSRSLTDLAREALHSVGAFRQLTAEGHFSIVLQPILDTVSGDIHHYEALARFPSEQETSPFDHIRFAEDTGLITEFDQAMVKKALHVLGQTPPADRVRFAVNVSGASILTSSYASELGRLLRANAWARGRLLFEITESAEIDDLAAADRVIQDLRLQGYAVCLDDFGAGASSFQYLSRLEVDIVKLDGSALRNARHGRKGRAMLKSIVGLCRELEVATIAEMVEDVSDLAFVRECGVDYVQGYLFGRPGADLGVLDRAVPRWLFPARSPGGSRQEPTLHS